MSIEKIIELQERIISRFEKLRNNEKKFTDEMIANAYVQQMASRYSLASYQLKQEYPELFKKGLTKEERKEYMKNYMRKYLPKYRRRKIVSYCNSNR